jgi:hypothetical protein
MVRTRIALVWAAGVALVVGVVAQAARTAPVPEAIFKASALYGLPFSNANNESLGKLHDIMVDEKGNIVYGVLSHGGLASVGDKLFAVPLTALQTLGDVPNHPERKQFVLEVSKATLDTQPGFNEKDYPTVPDPLFTKTTKDNETVRRTAATSDQKQYRMRALEGTAVRNQAGEDCGKVREFGVNLHDGNVPYAAFSYGGTARIGEKYFAAPWKEMELKSLTGKPTEMSFVVHVTKQTLDSNPGFNRNGFPSEADLNLFTRSDR